MRLRKRFVPVFGAMMLVTIGLVGVGQAAETPRHVVSTADIQAKMDQQVGQSDADHQAIQSLLQRADIRQAAGTAGLDLQRATAAAAVLSGPMLEKLAAQARMVNSGLSGGSDTIILSSTAVIIALLIIILLVR